LRDAAGVLSVVWRGMDWRGVKGRESPSKIHLWVAEMILISSG
jgi:hypothetical protein